jgi:hypothetical protein
MLRGLLFLLLIPVLAFCIACSEGAKAPNPVIGPGVQQDIAELNLMMKDLHALMFLGPFTEQQATEVSKMMLQVSAMMKEMSGPKGEQLSARNEQKLKEMRQRLETIKEQIKSQNKSLP